MTIKCDKWIRRMASEHGMIEPFEPGQVRSVDGKPIVSYGTSSYGYDIRCSNEFKLFTNLNSTIVDPKNFDPSSFVDVTRDFCIIPPNSFALARTVEYFRIPRNVMTICLGKSTYARCFRGDTRVALVDGSAVSLEDMARRSGQGEMFWGYSIGPNGRLIVTLLDSPRYVGRDSLVKVDLDNGESIHATPDHEFMRRDGRMVEAHALRPNDSLMPLYRDLCRGYEMVYQPINGFLYPTHRLADEWNVRHQSERSTKFWSDKRYAAIREKVLEQRRNPTDATREAHRQAMLTRYSDPAERARQGELMKKAWAADSGARRHRQAEIARNINIRAEITQQTLRAALDRKGSIRGAARLLDCDRSVFRRFPQPVAEFAGRRGTYRNHRVTSVTPVAGDHDVYCLTVPEAGNFALESGVFVHNCGIIVNVTPFEPEWEGYVTLEFSNTTPLPAKIYANEGVAQVIFFEADEVCETSYKDRGGKYQGQQGVTLPKM